MPDESDPPRKFYQLKPKEFEVVNERVPPPPDVNPSSAPDSGPSEADDGRIDVRNLFKQASRPAPLTKLSARLRAENDVHAILREKHARDVATGQYDLGPLDDSKRRRRIRNYWISVVAINAFLGFFAYKIGHTNAIPFVCAIAGMALATSYLTWQTFFLRTDY